MILPNRFINYRLQAKPDSPKMDKIPCDAKGNPINPHDPSQWMTYETAQARVSGEVSGVGFILNGDGWFCIDLDNCRNAQTGVWSDSATLIYLSFPGALAEVSVSGTGLHIFGRCDPKQLADRRNKWDGDKEWYHTGRFIALAPHGLQPIGDKWIDKDWTSQLLHLVPRRNDADGVLPTEVDPTYTGPADDDTLIAMMLRSSGSAASKFGAKASVVDLWNANDTVLSRIFPAYDGGKGFDHSSADAALMSHLAFWTGKDMARMDRLFRRSALMRDKYRDRDDYRRETIHGAARICKKVYDQPRKLMPGISSATHSVDHETSAQVTVSKFEARLASVDEIAKAFLTAPENQRRWLHVGATGVDLMYNGQVWVACKCEELLGAIRNFISPRIGGFLPSKNKPTFWKEVREAIRIDPQVMVDPARLDTDLHLLNTPAGTLDLRSGILRPHAAADRITHITTAAPCEWRGSRWDQFVLEICGGDAELAQFVQIAIGAALSGAIDDHWFLLIFGQGRNGKSLLIETVLEAVGSYGITIPSTPLMATRNPTGLDVLAQLQGKRLAVTSEVDASAHFDEALIKQLTGDRLLSVRPLFKNTYTVPRTFKLVIVGNHRPQLRTDDSAMRSRLKLVQMNQDFSGPRADPTLAKRLRAELGSVLQWMIDGHALYNKLGRLSQCRHVELQTEDYFSSQLTVEQWLATELCKVNDDGRAASQWLKSADLYRAYSDWCLRGGCQPMNLTRWSEAMQRNGLKKVHSNGVRYVGITTRAPSTSVPSSIVAD